MAIEYRDMIARVFIDVTEKMAYMFGDVVPADELPDVPRDAGFVKVSMEFSGPSGGLLTLAVPEKMCSELAANVLGLDSNDERAEEAAHDALKEILNVTCGNFLTEMAGEESVFDLTVPEMTLIGKEVWRELLASEEAVTVIIDAFPSVIIFSPAEASDY